MPTNSYRCFFITSMGEKRRKNSDLVMDVLLRPSLSQCGFMEKNVMRSDHLRGESIMSDMMEHLKNDELCIADLSDDSGNPNYNVMFECGYRRGLGRPLIYIAPVGFTKPFDISTDRIIYYDFSSTDAFQKLPDTLKALKEQVEYYIREGFLTPSGSGSVAEITERLNAIEKKLNDVLFNSRGGSISSGDSGDLTEVINDLGSPIQAFNYSLRGRNIQLAESLLPRLESTLSKERYIDHAVAQVCALGSEKAAAILKKEWDYIRDNLTPRQQYEELGCYVTYCNMRDRELEEMEFVRAKINEMLEMLETVDDNTLKAGVYNQLNRICFGAHQTLKKKGNDEKAYLAEAVGALERATNLNSSEISYFYNLAMCYHEQGNVSGAVKAIKTCLESGENDPKHFALAYRIFNENNMAEEAREVRAKLKELNPRMAAML